MERLKKFMRIVGFRHFRWFRKWHGGLWFCECTLGYGIQHGILHKYKDAYVTEEFTMVYNIERW